MTSRIRVLLMLAAFTLAIPAAAQVPVPRTTAFDGKYIGVSGDVSKAGSTERQCPRGGAPKPLTIRDGVIKPPTGKGWTGTVSPQGAVVIRNQYSMRVDAQIDPQGNVRGQYNGPGCVVTYVWRKQPA
jgi:hypothetical protein